MKSKVQRQNDGPGWVEVIFGAALSLVLGVVIAAAYLVFKPVTTVKELPKVIDPHVVYFVEGTKDSSKARDLGMKRKLLLPGNTVVFNEDELNFLSVPPAPAAAPKKMELPQPAAPAGDTFSAGNPNFRIRKDVLQVGLPVKVTALDMTADLVVQARGNFAKVGDTVVFQANEFYLGSCPLSRLPAARDYVINYISNHAKIPDEVVAAWKGLADAKVEGNNVRLTLR
jgi:hypothetical protein